MVALIQMAVAAFIGAGIISVAEAAMSMRGFQRFLLAAVIAGIIFSVTSLSDKEKRFWLRKKDGSQLNVPEMASVSVVMSVVVLGLLAFTNSCRIATIIITWIVLAFHKQLKGLVADRLNDKKRERLAAIDAYNKEQAEQQRQKELAEQASLNVECDLDIDVDVEDTVPVNAG